MLEAVLLRFLDLGTGLSLREVCGELDPKVQHQSSEKISPLIDLFSIKLITKSGFVKMQMI